ncbi:aminobenzoyl-glutamate transport protein [Hoylesella oralis]|nr:aminobenzoyl-glutamate transport protein [Hoylesella oralis]
MKNKILTLSALTLCIVQMLVILVSWLITAAMPDAPLRSLLSSEGIRWFFGHLTENQLTPLLAWMLFIVIAYGAMRKSGLLHAVRMMGKVDFRQKFALRIVIIEVILFLCVLLLLTSVPHAILLSVTGNLFPSSFSQSLIPCLSFACVVFSISYGVISGSFHSLSDVFKSFTSQIPALAPLLIVYILAAQLFYSLKFILII